MAFPENTPRRNLELVNIVAAVLGGTIAAALVYIGAHFEWPNFCTRQGHFGTQYLSGILYAINEPWAIRIVAVLWFSYVAIPIYFGGWLIRKVVGNARKPVS